MMTFIIITTIIIIIMITIIIITIIIIIPPSCLWLLCFDYIVLLHRHQSIAVDKVSKTFSIV